MFRAEEHEYKQTAKQHHQITLPSGETVDVKDGKVVLPGGEDQRAPLGTYQGAIKESYGWETAEHYNQKFKRLKKGRQGSFERIRERDRKSDRKQLPQLVYKRGDEADPQAAADKHASLLKWAQKVTAGYPGVNVRNLSSSWRDGLAFNSVLHRYRPNSVNWRKISSPSRSNRERLRVAFDLAEKEFGVQQSLHPADVDVPDPDEGKVVSYISDLRDALPEESDYAKYDAYMRDYNSEAREWMHWCEESTARMATMPQTHANVREIKRLLTELETFRNQEVASRFQTKQRLADLYAEFENLFAGSGQLLVDDDLSTPFLDRAWNELMQALETREEFLKKQLLAAQNLEDLVKRTEHNISLAREKLTLIECQVKDLGARFPKISYQEMKENFDQINLDLNGLGKPISQLFDDVQVLKSAGHPRADDLHKQVYALEQRRSDMSLTLENTQRELWRRKEEEENYKRRKNDIFSALEECLAWIRDKLALLTNMQFTSEVHELEQLLQKQKRENQVIVDFRPRVDQCASRSSEVFEEDASSFNELLASLQSEYQQLRDLSAGRALDMELLIAFIRAVQLELQWVSEFGEPQVQRDWSDINRLNIQHLDETYKQLLYHIERREDRYFSVYDQGVKMANSGHPAGRVIESCLNKMQSRWEWLLNLATCFEVHLQDAGNLTKYLEEARACEVWMQEKRLFLESESNGHDISYEQLQQTSDDFKEIQGRMAHYESVLYSLIEKSRTSSPLWQRAEKVTAPTPLQTLTDYKDKNITLHKGYECALLDNSDRVSWLVQTIDERKGHVSSVLFRIPPPDERLFTYMKQLHSQHHNLRQLLAEKQKVLKVNIIRARMMEIKNWNLDTFVSIKPVEREQTIKVLSADTHTVLNELHPNDTMMKPLRNELKETNEHFYHLLRLSQRRSGSDFSKEFDEKVTALLSFLEKSEVKLRDEVQQPAAQDSDDIMSCLNKHKEFEDVLQSCDTEVATVKELFHQLSVSDPEQKTRMDRMLDKWKNVWELSRIHVKI